jgi:hypothetical protein
VNIRQFNLSRKFEKEKRKEGNIKEKQRKKENGK